MINCPEGTFSYSVRYGDTLWIIAERFNVGVQDLIMLNPGIDPDVLNFGDIICVPLIEEDVEDIDEYLELNNLIRKLWDQHNSWTRLTILSVITGLPQLEIASDRLLKNADDMSNLFLSFYGEDIAREFNDMFLEHIRLAGDYIKAKKAMNINEAMRLESEWRDNADMLAAFFAEINPFWDYDAWLELLNRHLDLIIGEVDYFLGDSSNSSILLEDKMQRNGFMIADYILEGLSSQFPEYID